ncbi:glycosyltransferase family 2 protein [Leucobacter sp. NPDC058333]|uniref:glycosyltransferase family 2 protein n=1 Tax=Leucobacter sp. NPDC058333 TaxID=3346450 RepID=UPI00364FE7AF
MQHSGIPVSAPSTRVLVIVPAWNERANVAETVAEIRAADARYDVLVVDDGSTDDTADVARSAGALVLVLPFNLGVGGAMRAGFHYALRHNYQAAIQVDADGQHNPADIAQIVAALTTADIAIGARFADVGTYTAKGPRRWAMVLLGRALSGIARTRLTDVTSGFRAAGPRAIQQYVDYYPAEYLGDTVDSLVGALRAGLTVTQVPVAMRPRRHGQPSQGAIGSTIYLLRSAFALLIAVTRPASSNVQEHSA